ncbi:ribosome recycling factor [Terrilactibacillus sp. BCM23-1]|uniref:Ribosome-recycling factor n=1 Tax=Terrilactibacillus tamarindi TaxID=2599694 RepID=A0A6N8CPX9_9BACI|nr:ribosome recycling factor [Terrilactibacillus tamarindi]MTT32249.1 ribosome recycling factor [Terrilactibacillus tamarindi]
MANEVINDTKDRMDKALAALKRELSTIRAGRANPSILNKITVEYYGAQTPLNQLASITAPEARLLLIQPYDKTAIGEMEKAILKSDLGISPTNDGDVIRIAIPALTEERRTELVKIIKKTSEESKVAIRNIRRDANDNLKKSVKNNELTEDDQRDLTDQIQKLTDNYISKIDETVSEKEKEIMEV